MLNDLYVINANKNNIELDQLYIIIQFAKKYFPHDQHLHQGLRHIIRKDAIQVITIKD